MAKAKKDDTPAGGWLGPNTPGGGKTDLPASARKAIAVAVGANTRGWKWKNL
jgi:hypothetical protein